MPNTIAHFAVNGLVSRKLIPAAPLPLIYLGCIVPDIPWIFQRATGMLLPESDPFWLRLYFVNQASLFGCLFLCAGVAAMTVAWRRNFLVLALGSLLHLLLDACQIKWSNGVSLLVPFDWQLLRFDFFWPESPFTVLITLAGLVYYVVQFRTATMTRIEWTRRPWRWFVATVFLAGYVVAPLPWIDNAFAADNHSVATFHPDHAGERVGKSAEFDRERYHVHDDGSGELTNFDSERFEADGIELDGDVKISARGTFTERNRVVVSEYHVHHPWLREVSSYAGLLMILAVWLISLLRRGTDSASVPNIDPP